ncbi:ubiquitin and WLM domain-containing metalloprotease SPCC1442.07c-like [Prunus avium]|uniref:Ubiquitin and WLM domain-containing metalloprotease SPCC1442.07c-like n=1 Tax=Prunus avium TaxID=42229 RepID=A0A6P5TXD1_PRUAV|nr:ubiquitin and WLM domain-containing metalloprotease SPCC1442.07c-like [Prunus avium]
MMGVSEHEVDEVLQHAKTNLRIAGFDEEEMRLRQRMSYRPHTLKLPQGPYIFCDFRTLQLPGIELNPPVSEALKRMHMLAADPGIISVMNKHRWRVGIMTEMAPVGYVGISPKCILGFNKNHGQEISLRLRTDDLKGFKKYESIMPV